MNKVSRRVVLSYLCILIGYSILGIFAASLRFRFYFPLEVYWMSFVFVSIPLLYEVAFWNNNPKHRLIYLLSFSVIINLQYAVVDSSPFLSSIDAVADYRLTDRIIAGSEWSTSVKFAISSEYRFYPVTNFLYATTSMLTGIPLLLVVKYLFIIKGLVIPPLVIRWFRSFFDQRVAYLATMLFLASPGAILFPHKESFALIFFFVGMYASTRIGKTRQYLLVGLIAILTLIITHHFTTYIFLSLLTSLFLAAHFFKHQKIVRISTQFFMLCWVVFIAWVAFISWTIIATHQRLLYKVFFQVLLPGQVAFPELMPLYALYERVVVWLGYGITMFSAVLGFLRYTRNAKSRSSGFMAISLLLLPILAVASIFRFSPLSARANIYLLVSHRAYEFGYIIIGVFSALFFIWTIQSRKKLTLNVITIGAMVAMIMVGPMAGGMHPRTLVRVSDVVSFKAVSLTTWMSESADSDDYTVGDKLVFIILVGYGDSLVVEYSDLFTGNDFSLPPDIRSKSSYVVTYEYMTDFYGLNATKFNGSPYFQNIYTNGLLNTYGISNRTSS